MSAIDWAVAGQVAVGIVIGAFLVLWVFAYRAAKADDSYHERRYVK